MNEFLDYSRPTDGDVIVYGPPPHHRKPPPRNPAKTPRNPQWVKFTSHALHWDILYLLGDGPLIPTGGGGGFTEVTRQEDVSITYWAGMPPWRLPMPLIIDDWITGEPAPRVTDNKKRPPDFQGRDHPRRARRRWRHYRDRHQPQNVEQFTDLLKNLARPVAPSEPPPSLRVYSLAMPPWLNGMEFVIESIDWGETMHTDGGRLKRQLLTLNLMQDVEPFNYRIQKLKKRHNGGGGKPDIGPGTFFHGFKTYVVKQGDTLMKIAAKFYGNPNDWRVLANVNKIKNPRKLKVGDKIKIPT